MYQQLKEKRSSFTDVIPPKQSFTHRPILICSSARNKIKLVVHSHIHDLKKTSDRKVQDIAFLAYYGQERNPPWKRKPFFQHRENHLLTLLTTMPHVWRYSSFFGGEPGGIWRYISTPLKFNMDTGYPITGLEKVLSFKHGNFWCAT